MKKIIVGFVVCLGLFAFNVVNAANYPALKNNYVNDYAKVLSTADENDLRLKLQALETQKQVEVTVLTISSIRDYDKDKNTTLESFATNLFNKWGIGNLPKNDGVMLLVAIKDRKVRIELGSGYADSYNDIAKDIIDNDMIPLFKSGKPRDAIMTGVDAIIAHIVTADTSTTAGAPEIANANGDGASMFTNQASALASSWLDKANHALQRISPHLSVPLLGGGAGGLFIFTWLTRLFLRNRPRRCNTCGGTMQRLDESGDDAFLDAGQLVEERLSSVDYDVWKCAGCNVTQVYAYKKWFSSYDNCPGCNKRTLKTTSRVTCQATYTSTGSKLVTEDCQNCSYHQQRTVTIPVKQRSSSSSSSSGGGRSSGGGASGSW